MFQGYVNKPTLCHFKIIYTYFVIFCTFWALKGEKKFKIKKKRTNSEARESTWYLFVQKFFRKKLHSPKLINICTKFFFPPRSEFLQFGVCVTKSYLYDQAAAELHQNKRNKNYFLSFLCKLASCVNPMTYRNFIES